MNIEKIGTEKIKEWHKLIVIGLNNGLSHANKDGRTDEIDFWKQRSILFDRFSHCVMGLVWGNSTDLDEKELKQVAEEGYK
jgi:hypothetical protein